MKDIALIGVVLLAEREVDLGPLALGDLLLFCFSKSIG